MSRIGFAPIVVPFGVKVEVKDDKELIIEGPKGRLRYIIPQSITVSLSKDKVTFGRTKETRSVKSLHGLTRSLVNNMVIGVTEGFSKDLEISGVGYRAELKDGKLILHLGYSHPIIFEVPDGIELSLKDPTHIKVSGIDKELVGRVAASLRSLRPPDSYKAKGIRYEGEYIRRKAGKGR